MSGKRDDFSKKTKEIIAGRAGYCCSFPGCKKILIGPGENGGVVSIGECAHIYSAAGRGPRGQNTLSKEELKSEKNGIYLCCMHHKIVDSDESRYTPSVLLNMKARHEFFISRQMGNYISPTYWIKSIEIDAPEIYGKPIKIELGRVTYIYGDNNTGKSYFCSAIFDSVNSNVPDNAPNKVVFILENISKEKIECIYDVDTRWSYLTNQQKNSFLPVNISAVFLRGTRLDFSDDHVNNLALFFDIKTDVVLNIIKSGQLDCLEDGVDIEEYQDDESGNNYRKIYTFVNKHRLPLDQCSSGEQSMFIIKFGIVLSRLLSTRSSVVFVMDWNIVSILDQINVRKILDLLNLKDNCFQTILFSPKENADIDWNGWAIAKLIGKSPNVSLIQDFV